MSKLSQKQISTLTADRYKLVFPFHAYRNLSRSKVSNFNQEEIDGVQSPVLSNAANVPSQLTQQRPVLPNINNDNVKVQADIVKQYLQELRIPMTIENFTSELLQNNILPYNPYPGYIKRFRRVAERFYTEQRTLHEIKKKLDTPIIGLEGTYLSRAKHSNHTIFGMQHIVSHVHSETLFSYQPILAATVTDEMASQVTGKKISVIKSLFGPGIFSSSFYSDLPCVDIRVSILISSFNIKEAAKIFAKVVMEDAKLVFQHKLQHLLELEVDTFNRGMWVVGKWSRSALTIILDDDQRRSSVENAIAEAVEGSKKVSLKLMTYNADRLLGNYVFTTKVYDLMLLKTRADPSKTTSASVSPQGYSQLIVSSLPYLSLLEGVFLELSEVKLYISTFEKYYIFPNGKKATKAYPLNPDVLNPILENWENQIASKILEHSAFSTIHYMLLAHLARSKTSTFTKHTEKDFAIQVCRYHDGTAVRLQNALFLTQALSSLANSVGETDNATAEILPKIQDLINNVIQECFCSSSSEKKILEELLEAVFRSSFSVGSVNKGSLQLLKCHFFLAILAANEDVLEGSPAILSFRKQINSMHPTYVPSLADLPTQTKSQHGVRNAAWINVDSSKVDMEKSIATSQAPKSVSSSASMMQYCMDIRIDEIWKDFMDILLLVSDHLPPNPFPHLVAVMRRGSMSVQSLFENDAAVVSRVLQRKRIPVQELNESETCNVPGTNAYGYRSSLVLLNTTGFRQYSSLASSVFINAPGETTSGYPLQLGPFRANVCSGFVDTCPFYGSLTPYLTSVDVDEHFFVFGFRNDSRSPLSSLAQKLLSSLVELRSKGAVLHQAKFGQIKLDLFTLANSAARFESEFTTAVEGSQFVVFSFYFPLTWRYILVTKRILVYFSEQGEKRITRMFQHSSYTEKRSSTVFLHPNDANYCLRPGRILPFAVTNFIKSTWPSRDWSPLIKALATHAQLLLSSVGSESKSSFGSQMSNDDLAKVLAAFCYRYSNGLPGQLDYLLAMNNALENLVSHAIAALSENSDVSSVLRLSLVDVMMEEYMVKTRDVTSRSSALLPASFSDFLLIKLKAIAPRNPNSNALHLRYNKTSLETLHELEGYLTCARNCLAEDLLLASPVVAEFILNQLRHS